jgi:hypothetical protein
MHIASFLRRLVMPSMAFFDFPYFFTSSYKRPDLQNTRMGGFFSTNLSETFLVLRIIRRDITISVHMS